MTIPTMPPGFETLLEQTCATTGVPAIAVSVTHKGQLRYAAGSGTLRLGDLSPVDGDTAFAIGSVAKSFTVAMIDILIQDGKIGSWDDPVKKYLTWFETSVPGLAEKITLRHIATHTTGIKESAGDIYWMISGTAFNKEHIARRIASLPWEDTFHPEHQYSNTMFIALGVLIEEVSGMTWEQFIYFRILTPLQMVSTCISAKDVPGNLAMPHLPVAGALRPDMPIDFVSERPGGGLWSTARDMAKWAKCLLSDGKLPDGTQLLTEAGVAEMMKPAILTPNAHYADDHPLKPLESMFRAYCMGLVARDYQRRLTVFHTGWIHGYMCILFLVPELELGITVLTNAEIRGGAGFLGIVYTIVDHFLNLPTHDWLGAILKFKQQLDEHAEKQHQDALQQLDPASPPSYPLPNYVGTFHAEGFGDVVINFESTGLVLRLSPSPNTFVGDLTPAGGDRFRCVWRTGWLETATPTLVTFELADTGSVKKVTLKPLSDATDTSYSFGDLKFVPRTP